MSLASTLRGSHLIITAFCQLPSQLIRRMVLTPRRDGQAELIQMVFILVLTGLDVFQVFNFAERQQRAAATPSRHTRTLVVSFPVSEVHRGNVSYPCWHTQAHWPRRRSVVKYGGQGQSGKAIKLFQINSTLITL